MAENSFILIPMYVFWREVLEEVNRVLLADYKYQGYISEVYSGTKRNANIEEVLDECIDKVNKALEGRGLRSKNPIEPRR